MWFCAGIAVFSVSLIHLANAGNMWPNEVGVVDHQHVGLYMVIIIFSGLGIVAQMTKLKKPHWNVPFTLIAICMSMFFFLFFLFFVSCMVVVVVVVACVQNDQR